MQIYNRTFLYNLWFVFYTNPVNHVLYRTWVRVNVQKKYRKKGFNKGPVTRWCIANVQIINSLLATKKVLTEKTNNGFIKNPKLITV